MLFLFFSKCFDLDATNNTCQHLQSDSGLSRRPLLPARGRTVLHTRPIPYQWYIWGMISSSYSGTRQRGVGGLGWEVEGSRFKPRYNVGGGGVRTPSEHCQCALEQGTDSTNAAMSCRILHGWPFAPALKHVSVSLGHAPSLTKTPPDPPGMAELFTMLMLLVCY